jgi:hypothetical protein
VAGLVAQLARRGGAVASRMALKTAEIAGACERALDTRIGAVRLVVTDLAAVVALASEAATLRSGGTLAGEMAGLIAAAVVSVGKSRSNIESKHEALRHNFRPPGLPEHVPKCFRGVYSHAAGLVTIASASASAAPRIAAACISSSVTTAAPRTAAACVVSVSLTNGARGRTYQRCQRRPKTW